MDARLTISLALMSASVCQAQVSSAHNRVRQAYEDLQSLVRSGGSAWRWVCYPADRSALPVRYKGGVSGKGYRYSVEYLVGSDRVRDLGRSQTRHGYGRTSRVLWARERVVSVLEFLDDGKAVIRGSTGVIDPSLAAGVWLGGEAFGAPLARGFPISVLDCLNLSDCVVRQVQPEAFLVTVPSSALGTRARHIITLKIVGGLPRIVSRVWDSGGDQLRMKVEWPRFRENSGVVPSFWSVQRDSQDGAEIVTWNVAELPERAPFCGAPRVVPGAVLYDPLGETVQIRGGGFGVRDEVFSAVRRRMAGKVQRVEDVGGELYVLIAGVLIGFIAMYGVKQGAWWVGDRDES